MSRKDLEHLRILSILYYVAGGLGLVGASVPIIHVILGVAMLSGALNSPGGAGPPPEFGLFFIVIGGGIMLLGYTMAVGMIVAGRCLARRRWYMFCFVMACIICTSVPLGTLLGIFTIINLVKPGMKEVFASGREPEPAPREDY